MNLRASSRVTIRIVAVVLAFASYAKAGPPLICHRFEIGNAKSLPLIDWSRKDTGGYDLKNLSRDTLGLLQPNTPVLVRMETLRRASIYARHDQKVAKELLTRLHARAAESDAAGHPDALAWFDAGYLAETYKQWFGKVEANPATGVDGYAWVKRAISLRGEDAEMEFAAALITMFGPEGDHHDHTRKAFAGAKNNPLLAQNLASSLPEPAKP